MMTRSSALLLLVAFLGLPGAALSQTTTERTISVRQGTRLALHTVNGSIRVRAWDRNTVHLVARHDPQARVEIDEEGTTLRVSTHPGGKKQEVVYTVSVPRAMDLELHAVHAPISVEGASGRVAIHNVKGAIQVRGGNGLVEANSVEGGVSVQGARGRISAHSVNAGVVVADCSGTIEVGAVNGGLRLARIDSRSVEATSVNGGIDYDGSIYRDGVYRFKSHNGGVTVTVPEGVGADVTVSTFNGSFSASFPVTFREAHQGKTFGFVLGTGGAKIELQSFNGPIRLRRPGQQ
jgi:DUF4097 and DUF4098 domain-containing protein YvlB